MLALANASDGDSSAQAQEVKKFRASSMKIGNVRWSISRKQPLGLVSRAEPPLEGQVPARHRTPKEASSREYRNAENDSPEELPEVEKLNYDLYGRFLADLEEGMQYGDDAGGGSLWMPLNQLGGIHRAPRRFWHSCRTKPLPITKTFWRACKRCLRRGANSRAAARWVEAWLHAAEDYFARRAEAARGFDSCRADG